MQEEMGLFPHVQKHRDTRQATLVLQLVGCFMKFLVFPRIRGIGLINVSSKIPIKHD